MTARDIEASLLRKETDLALAWCAENRSRLRKNNVSAFARSHYLTESKVGCRHFQLVSLRGSSSSWVQELLGLGASWLRVE